jgi:hypothetical protein
MARWVTAEKLASIESLAGKTESEVDEIVAAAGKLYEAIRSNEWITDGDLRVEAERQGISPDVATAALDLLREEGRVKRLVARATAEVAAAESPLGADEPKKGRKK